MGTCYTAPLDAAMTITLLNVQKNLGDDKRTIKHKKRQKHRQLMEQEMTTEPDIFSRWSMIRD